MAKPLLHAWTAVLMSSPRTAGCIACGAAMVLQHFFDASSDWHYWCPQVVWGGDLDYRLQVKLPKGAERNHFKNILAEEQAWMEEQAEEDEEPGEEGGQEGAGGQWQGVPGGRARARGGGARAGGPGVAGGKRARWG